MSKKIAAKRQTGTKGGVQSVEVGMTILKTLSSYGGKASLNELSEQTGIHPAKVHRYLVSLVETGFVTRTAHGHYDLGPYVLEFATSYLSRLNPTSIATSMIEQLWTQTNEGVILSVWGAHGTTVIRWLQSRQPISVGIRPGTTLSTTMSASGRIFLAYLSPEATQSSVEMDLALYNKTPHPLAPTTMDEVDALSKETRKKGLARVTGHNVEYVSSVAAPVFDYRGEVVMSLALFGFKTNFDVDWNGSNAKLLKRITSEISSKLGYVTDK